MKRLYFFVVATLVLGCFGCANLPIEEDSVVVEPADYTLEVSIAEPHTKVSLGSKGENGVYPLYWSAGDRILVNGHKSSEAIIDEANPSCARFSFEDVILNYPYDILYPVNDLLLESLPVVGGSQTFSSSANVGTYGESVIFSSQQNYVEGGFESGTTPMYGRVTNSSEGIKLNHLSGVLRFAILGSDNTSSLASMTITAESGAIAGAFDIDFSTGKLTPNEGATNILNYSFGEGLSLSTTEAMEFFVVLPCGEFGLCTAVLRLTDGKEMTIKFNTSGASAVKAGIVREFKAVTFKKGVEVTLAPFESESDDLIVDKSAYAVQPTMVDGEYLVINNEKELMWLCFYGTTVSGVTYNKVRLGQSIDMGVFSLVSLPAMKLNAGVEIDGNNKSITGLNIEEESSSIFGDTNNLNIHDLTLIDCSVKSSLQTGAGILVGKVSEALTVNNVSFNNCSVMAPCKIGLVAGALHTGTFNVSNVVANGGVVETSYVSGKSGLAGGLVGCIAKSGDGATTSTASFTNCTTSATVKSYMEGTNYFYGKMVGQFGGYNGDEKLYFVNCNGEDATLVPMYDQGTKNAESAVLSFCEAHRADFCQTTLTSATDNLLGGERYCRGEVYFDGNRFFYEWDGKRSATMIEDGDGRNLVYSPFDLAKAQGVSYGDTTGIVFMTSVDMGGHTFKPINYVRYLDGGNFELHNLKVVRTHDAANNRGAGFIVYASGTTVHKNLTFVGADVTCNHDSTIAPLEYGNDNDGGAGNAYAGTLVSRSWRSSITDANGDTTGYTTYTISNVHARDGKVRGVCKVGGLVGAMRGEITMDNCSVDNYVVENYDPQVANYYIMTKSIASNSYMVEGLQWWYTAGECGGLIGFLEAHYAEITNCAVTNTQINCVGQPNKEVYANVWKASDYVAGAYTNGSSLFGSATTHIAGRHINQFIGDIRSRRTESQQTNGTGEYTNKIINYTVSGNTYNGVAAESTNVYNHNYASGKYCDAVGCAYYTGVDINLIIASSHVSECAGTLIFQPKGGTETTLTEAIGKGNNMDWYGGDGSISMWNQKSYYPEAPAN